MILASIKNVILILVLLFSFLVRFQNSPEIRNFNFGDGGRDLLMAKHMADGSASLLEAPNSGFKSIPNTPVYYWYLALGYKLGGLTGALLLNILTGTLLVYLCYLIVLGLWKNDWLALGTAALAAISHKLIYASVNIWSPWPQLALIAATIFLATQAITTKQSRYYWLSLPIIFLAISFHTNTLPLGIITSIFLLWNYGQTTKLKKQPLKFLLWAANLGLVWLSWFVLTFRADTISSKSNLWQDFNPSKIAIDLLPLKFSKMLEFINEIHQSWLLFPDWLQLGLLILVFAGLLKNFWFGPLSKKIVSYIFFIQLTILLFVIIPTGAEFRDWYFGAQIFLNFILVSNLPWLLMKPNSIITKIIQVGWFILLTWFSWSGLVVALNPSNDSHFLTDKVAKSIIKDVAKDRNNPNNFALIHNDRDFSETSLEKLRTSWNVGGIELMMENSDQKFATRFPMIYYHNLDSNILEPDLAINYVICTRFTIENKSTCVDKIISDVSGSLTKIFVAEISYGNSAPVFIYKVIKH